LNSEDEVRRYYSKLLKLPSIRLIQVVFFAVLSSIVLFSLSLRAYSFALSYCIFTASVLLLFRRQTKESLLFSSIAGILSIAFRSISLPPSLAYPFYIPFMAASSMVYRQEYKAILISLIPPILAALPLSEFYFTVLDVGVVALILLSYFATVNRKGKNITGYTSMEVARPFIRSVTESTERFTEEFLYKISVPVNVPVLIVRLRSSKDAFLVLPKVHFGLFGNVGSTKLIYQIDERVKNALVLHGPGSHDLDVVTNWESQRIAEEISRAINGEWRGAEFMGLSVDRISNFVGFSLNTKDFRLTFLTRPHLGIDDLPTSLWEYMVKNYSFIVDCHNEYKERDFQREEIEALKAFLIRRGEAGQGKKLRMGFAEARAQVKCRGLCDDRVKVLALEDGSKRFLVVYIYANNSTKDLSEALRLKLSGLADEVILVTPDDHSCTAITPRHLYHPAEPCESLLKAVEEASMRALSEMEETAVQYKIIIVRKVHVVGKFISVMEEGLRKIGDFVMKTVWIPLLSPLLGMTLALLVEQYVKLLVYLL
jgi:putative membrane protein